MKEEGGVLVLWQDWARQEVLSCEYQRRLYFVSQCDSRVWNQVQEFDLKEYDLLNSGLWCHRYALCNWSKVVDDV